LVIGINLLFGSRDLEFVGHWIFDFGISLPYFTKSILDLI